MDGMHFKNMVKSRDYNASYLMDVYNKYNEDLVGFDILHEAMLNKRFDLAYLVLQEDSNMGNLERQNTYFDLVAKGISLDNIEDCEAWRLVSFFHENRMRHMIDDLFSKIIEKKVRVKERVEGLIRAFEILLVPAVATQDQKKEITSKLISYLYFCVFMSQGDNINIPEIMVILSDAVRTRSGIHRDYKEALEALSGIIDIDDLNRYYVVVSEIPLELGLIKPKTLAEILRYCVLPFGRAHRYDKDVPVLVDIVERGEIPEGRLTREEFEILLDGMDPKYYTEVKKDTGHNALVVAAQLGNVDYVKALLNKRAFPTHGVGKDDAMESAFEKQHYDCVLAMAEYPEEFEILPRHWPVLYRNFHRNPKAFEILKSQLNRIVKHHLYNDKFAVASSNVEPYWMKQTIEAIFTEEVRKEHPKKAQFIVDFIMGFLPYHSQAHVDATRAGSSHLSERKRAEVDIQLGFQRELFVNNIHYLLDNHVSLRDIWESFDKWHRKAGEAEEERMRQVFADCIRPKDFFEQILVDKFLLAKSLNYMDKETLYGLMGDSSRLFKGLNHAMAEGRVGIENVFNFLDTVGLRDTSFFAPWIASRGFKIEFVPISALREVRKIDVGAEAMLLHKYPIGFSLIYYLVMQGRFIKLIELCKAAMPSIKLPSIDMSSGYIPKSAFALKERLVSAVYREDAKIPGHEVTKGLN